MQSKSSLLAKDGFNFRDIKMSKFLLEIFNGGSHYISIDSMAELDMWRQQHKPFQGQLWTRDGYPVDEDAQRKLEQSGLLKS